jgi:hypothetical protein
VSPSHACILTIQAIIIKQRTVEAVVEMLDAQDYPAAAPQAVAVYLLLELVAGHHAGNTAAVFAAGMLTSVNWTADSVSQERLLNSSRGVSILSSSACLGIQSAVLAMGPWTVLKKVSVSRLQPCLYAPGAPGLCSRTPCHGQWLLLIVATCCMLKRST